MNRKQLFDKKKMMMDLFHDPVYKPMRARDLMLLLQIPRERNGELHEVLDALIADGKIAMDKKGRYRLVEEEVKTGIFHATTRGFGFVTVEGLEKDVFISEADTKDAFHGDEVEIKIIRHAVGSRSAEGKVLRVLKHKITEVTGIFERSPNHGFVVPDDQKFGRDIYISKGHCKTIKTGNRVLVKLLSYGTKYKSPEGDIIQDFGPAEDERNDVEVVLRAFGIPDVFPDEEMDEVAGIPMEVQACELNGRLDLRKLMTVTIDGADAKDLDDAITLSFEDGIYHLGVHIADVSHYVREGSPLDRNALLRGTSVYLINTVIPMLPKELSNGICSLNQGTDRLAMSCLMDIDTKGNILSHQIAETVIRVDRRMTYDAVYAVLEGDEAAMKEHADYVDFFRQMAELSDLLRKKRVKRGALNFDFPESKIYLDDMGHVESIVGRMRNTATDLIEDFMLAANETIAEDSYWQELPFVYRIHEEPDTEKLNNLTQMIAHLGYGMKGLRSGKEFHSKELQKLLDKCKDTPEEMFILRSALRSMKQAKYATTCAGHFGLAAPYYCHFTSPIRRYPDLIIHRILKENLHGSLTDERLDHYKNILDQVAQDCSATERRAEEAERELTKMKMAAYMEDHIGETYEGMVTSIMDWGIYVELSNTIEGMIAVEDLHDDYYIYNKMQMSMEGSRTRRTFEIGMKLSVKVLGVDRQSKSIYFLPADLMED